ncbi:enoyl-CoA hydratase/isomerase family protein [Siccirubricoccus sp. KC 17139]|uniref:Enoyl-CoA hydratase/isomerase family protein n=1 Tax=Siccirubricoccus soli TaxID=2899147 RepID=A0ABT1CZX6_9PROT|nr:enoyl-CoA hydratase/isomerase family protein [Siccirubricoccus soli]MCO6415220.1 enoyl-CoA hydratase/isomerase family protein [Siccirubricoccus soli]MCP2681351.1 enoyl-CoA hydratase/isomerase family protein [Siccirubricoccus soli]
MTDRYARYQRLLFDRPHPRVLRITMNNGRMNTADQQMHAELGEVWRDIDTDPSVSAVLLTGGPKVFSAGGDMALVEAIADDSETRARNWKEARDIVYNVINCSKPIVSTIRGPAVGAGLVAGLLADVSIAAKDARIIDGHTKLGVAAGDHCAIIWPLLCGMAKAKYYLLLCDVLSGEEAERIGVVSLAVDDAELDAKGLDVATRLAEGPPSAIRWTKYALNNWLRQAGPTFDASLALEFLGFTGPEVREGVAAFREKRKPAFPAHCPL